MAAPLRKSSRTTPPAGSDIASVGSQPAGAVPAAPAVPTVPIAALPITAMPVAVSKTPASARAAATRTRRPVGRAATAPKAPAGGPVAAPASGPLERAAAPLTSVALARMTERYAWFRELPPDERSWVGLVAQSGIAAFLRWLSSADGNRPGPEDVATNVFGSAPRAMARAVSLQQTVDLVRIAIEVVEEHVPALAPEADQGALREAVLVFSRDVAFASAAVYARAAEERGAWDARMEALIVDHVLRDEPGTEVLSRAAALGWDRAAAVVVLAGAPPAGDTEAVLAGVHRAAARAHLQVLAGVHSDLLAVVVGLPEAVATNPAAANPAAANAATTKPAATVPAAAGPAAAARVLLAAFGPGPVAFGQSVAGLDDAGASARAALAGVAAAAAWTDAPRPVDAAALLPERVLAGDGDARALLCDVYTRLRTAGPGLLETVAAYVDHGGSLEATGRALFVHPNTVRYRLKQATSVTGLALASPRGRFEASVALAVGRLYAGPDL